jgi:TP901 family phage tail tape measure protein/lambda family phage tail tape measure protein
MATLRLGIDARLAKAGAATFVRATDSVRRGGKAAVTSLRSVNTRMKAVGATASATSKRLTGLFAGISAVIAVRNAVRTIAEFEEAMVTLGAVSRATTSQLRDLEEVAREIGSTTRFSASEAASGLLFLARAGFSVQEQMDALPATLNLAQVGLLDLGLAADIASNVVSQFNLTASDTTSVVDALVIVSNRANTDVRQLSEALKFAGTVSGALGETVESTASALGVLGDRGIQASLAGTNLRGVMGALLDRTDKLNGSLVRLGISYDDVNPEEKNLVEIFETFAAAGLSASEAVKIFGRRNAAAGLILASSTEQMKALEQATKDFKGEAEEIARRQSLTLIGRFKALTSAMSEMAIASGESGLLGGLKRVTSALTEIVTATTSADKAMKDLTPTAKTLAIALGSVFLPFGLPLKLAGVALYALRGNVIEVKDSVVTVEQVVDLAWRTIANNTDILGLHVKGVWQTIEAGFAVTVNAMINAWEGMLLDMELLSLNAERLIPVGFGGRYNDEIESDLAVIKGKRLASNNREAELNLEITKDVFATADKLKDLESKRLSLSEQFAAAIKKQGKDNIQTMKALKVAADAAVLGIVGFINGGGKATKGFSAQKSTAASLEEINAEIDAIEEAQMALPFEKFTEALGRSRTAAEELGQSVSDSIRGGLEDAIVSFESFEDIAKQVFLEIQRAAVRAQIGKFLGSGNFFGPDGGGAVGPTGESVGSSNYDGGEIYPFDTSANGNVFSGGSRVAFARGGVVQSPTLFPMANNKTGLMGEAGPEAIMPLTRGPDGRLGVEAAGGPKSVTLNIHGVTNADSFQKSRRQIQSGVRKMLR